MNATRETDIVELDDGTEWTVSSLGLLELEALETFIQGRVMNAGRASLPEDITPQVEERMMQPVIAYAMNTNITDDDGFTKLLNFSGITRLIYHSLKRSHPDITLEKCRQFVATGPDMKKFLDTIVRVNKLKYQGAPKEKHPIGSAVKADRQIADNAGPEYDVRDAAKRDSGVVSESASNLSESNGHS